MNNRFLILGIAVLLLVVGLGGCIDSLPAVTISASKITGYQPLNVSFTLDVGSDESIQSYYWNFGDGGTSAQKNPTHVFQEDGSYTVQVIVSDNIGRAVTKTINISVLKSIELKIQGIYGISENNKLTEMRIYVMPQLEEGDNVNPMNISINVTVLDKEVSLTYGGFVIDYYDEDGRFGLTVNLSECFGGVPPRTFVNGTIGNIEGVIDGIINFCTPSDLNSGGFDLQ